MIKDLVTVFVLFSAILGFAFMEECTPRIADVVFVVDDSTSVQKTNYAFVLDFVAEIVGNVTVGPDAVQVSFLSFSNTVRNQFYLNQYSDTASAVKKIKSIRFRGGGTNIQRALNDAYVNNFAAARGARANVEKVLFLITDGESSGVESTAQEIRDAGIKILCVGISDSVTTDFLATISGDESKVYHVTDFDDLTSIQDELIKATWGGKSKKGQLITGELYELEKRRLEVEIELLQQRKEQERELFNLKREMMVTSLAQDTTLFELKEKLLQDSSTKQ